MSRALVALCVLALVLAGTRRQPLNQIEGITDRVTVLAP
jgi:hypothetical protein